MAVFGFTEADFGLVTSAADLLPRVRDLVAGVDLAGLVDRRLPQRAGEGSHQITLNNYWDEQVYVVEASPNSTVEVELDGENDGALWLADVYGDALIDADANESGLEAGSAAIEVNAPHFLAVYQYTEAPGDFLVQGNVSLVPMFDPDDGRTLTIGESIVAVMDYPGDYDHFFIELRRGETIDVLVDSALFDPYLKIDFLGATEEEIKKDDDSGGGFFGLNAKLSYTAPDAGEFFIVVYDADFAEIGGYVLTISRGAR